MNFRASFVLSVLLAGCGSSSSSSGSPPAPASTASDAGTDAAETPKSASPTGALSFGFIGDGRDGCGGSDPAKACSTSLPIVFASTATIRVRGAAQPLADTDKLELTWIPATSRSGAVQIAYEPSLYCDTGRFTLTQVAKKTDCTGKAFFEHFVRVSMTPPDSATGGDAHYGDGFLRVSRSGQTLDELPLKFRAALLLKVDASPAKSQYAPGDIINVSPTFTSIDDDTTPLYAETGAVTCRLDSGSFGNADVSPLKTAYDRDTGGIEIVPMRSNVAIAYKCVAAYGLGFSADGAAGSLFVGR